MVGSASTPLVERRESGTGRNSTADIMPQDGRLGKSRPRGGCGSKSRARMLVYRLEANTISRGMPPEMVGRRLSGFARHFPHSGWFCGPVSSAVPYVVAGASATAGSIDGIRQTKAGV